MLIAKSKKVHGTCLLTEYLGNLNDPINTDPINIAEDTTPSVILEDASVANTLLYILDYYHILIEYSSSSV